MDADTGASAVALALAVAQFRDCADSDMIAAMAVGERGSVVLTYGHLRALHERLVAAEERLGRIVGWHSRETADGGMVGDFCNECGHTWPCDTQRMAEGTYVDGR